MRRLGVGLASCAVLAVAVLLLTQGDGEGSSYTRDRARPALVVRVDPAQRSYRFRPGAVGLSLETRQLSSEVLSWREHPLVALMRRLGPATLRIGGNSTDRSWWTSGEKPKPDWATNTVTPADLRRLRGLLDAVNWQAILTVNLGHFEPQRAASEARSAAAILGTRLRAIEVGNEPNAFGTSVERLRPPSYSVEDYLRELSAYQTQILTKAPAVRFSGPDLTFSPSSHTWLPRIAEVRPPPFDEITHHYYPTAYNLPEGPCKRTPNPLARELLAPETREYENILLSRVATAGALAHRPTRVSETNTTSSCNAGGGPNTSPVFASALWALDWTLRAASSGVSEINFHGRFAGCLSNSFSPICAPRGGPSPHPVARPEYYGLLAARELEGGRFVSVKLQGPKAARGELTAYATERADDTLTMAIDNFSPRGATPVAITAPGYTSGSARRLDAPSIHAKRRVTFGHVTIGGGGPDRPRSTPLRREGDTFYLRSPASSAQIVTLTPASG
jgi:hypothetical protein